MIRPAVADDLPALGTMGVEFFAASGFSRWYTYKPASFSQFCIKLMTHEDGLLLVGDGPNRAVAMAGAMAYPVYFNDEHLTCQEAVWWVEPTHRGSLLGVELRKGMEDWARSKGGLTMEMGALEAKALRPQALEALYRRIGYEPKERIFCKRLVA